ncbi:hypothetical protein HWV62_37356 [Athelia sp. TMB]|nr:hypothetical protein HWV62_37356 [Athelia sp. TMB]
MLNAVDDMFLDQPALVRIPICVKLEGAAIDLDLAVATYREEGLGKGDSLITGEFVLLDRFAEENLGRAMGTDWTDMMLSALHSVESLEKLTVQQDVFAGVDVVL